MEFLLDVLRFLWIIFLVLLVFNFMIIVHEWGHFLAARWRGLVVDRFQIWFGKPIWKKTYNGVQYGLGTIPAGGFVSLPQMITMESVEGEVEDEVKKDLAPISALDKIIVAFAGPLFSFLLAVFFAVIVWAVGKPVPDQATSRLVGFVAEGGPAQVAGIQPGDEIISVDGQPIRQIHGMIDSVDWLVIAAKTDQVPITFERNGETKKTSLDISETKEQEKQREQENAKKSWWQKTTAFVFDRPPLPSPGLYASEHPRVGGLMKNSPGELAGFQQGDILLEMNGIPVIHRVQVGNYVENGGGEPVEFLIERDGKEMTLTATPRKPETRPEDGNYDHPMVGIQWDQFGKGELKKVSPYEQVRDSVRTMKNTLGAIFTPDSKIKGTHLSSAVGIMRLYYRLFEHPDGWRLVLWFSVVLNINLAILNMLPLPILDGGHITMAIVEGITRRPLPPKFLGVLHGATFIFLIGLMVVLLFKDVGDIAKDSGGGGPAKIAFEKQQPE
ncbi:MAG: PDZ domain-containing protein [Verrucomicrobiales bacterium]|nr:PDZ domain-containing protein [Verrucomicrobiales bacterium]